MHDSGVVIVYTKFETDWANEMDVMDEWDFVCSEFWIDILHCSNSLDFSLYREATALIARFMGPTWGPSVADRTQVGPMLAPWTLLSGWSEASFMNDFQS